MAAPMAAENPELLKQYVEGTIDYLPYVHNEAVETNIGVAPFQLTVIRDYSVEVLLETVRRRVDPLLPSRLSAVFAFDNRKDAVRAARTSGRPIDEVYEFMLAESPLTRVARANFDIISLLRTVIYEAAWEPSGLEGIAERYWTGGGHVDVEIPNPRTPGKFKTVTAKERWEFLIEGRLDRVGGPLGYAFP